MLLLDIIYRLNHRCFCAGPSQEQGTVGQQKINEEDINDTLLKKKILDSALQFVNQYGWSKASISAGAEILGYPGIIHGMYTKGGIELVQHFYMISNNNLVDFLKARSATTSTEPSIELSRSLVRDAIEERLRMIIPYIGRWPEALALMSQPQNVPTSLANLLTMVDDICYYAGDRSVNMSWYSRRVGLAGLYKVTELYLLQDKSEDFAKTWNFLNRRMEEAEHLHGYFLQTENASHFAKQFASATFTTARNILGLHWNR